jgi:hypothetical protein
VLALAADSHANIAVIIGIIAGFDPAVAIVAPVVIGIISAAGIIAPAVIAVVIIGIIAAIAIIAVPIAARGNGGTDGEACDPGDDGGTGVTATMVAVIATALRLRGHRSGERGRG